MSRREVQYAIRRADDSLMFGEYGWEGVNDPDDWEVAQTDSESFDDDADPPEYEMVELTIRPIARKTFKRGKEVTE